MALGLCPARMPLLANPGPSLPEAPCVDSEVEGAYRHSKGGDQGVGEVGVDGLVKIVDQKAAGPCMHAGFGFERLLGQSQRTGPGAGLDDDSPDERKQVKRGYPGASACPQGSGDDPDDPGEMNGEDRCRKGFHRRDLRAVPAQAFSRNIYPDDGSAFAQCAGEGRGSLAFGHSTLGLKTTQSTASRQAGNGNHPQGGQFDVI
jgi:hypothetical protein